ncbi:probable G-protein coupled receptor Mth-like 3 [Centruroides vittatus]|uniref:probable G-protein coupled receptor Mth-like 3 n=1 Tax=Centruroides vittatus TaxID=120091 RepID=UPI00350E9EC2
MNHHYFYKMSEENFVNITLQEKVCTKNCSLNQTMENLQTCEFVPEIRYLLTLCVVLSILCAYFVSIVYLCISEFRNLHGKILISISLCLGTFYTTLLLGVYLRPFISNSVCVLFGTIIYIVFIASFYWTNALSYDIWRGLTNKTLLSITHHRRQYLKYSIYAWVMTILTSIPMIIVQNTSAVKRFHPRLGYPFCWIAEREAKLIYLNLPVGLILASNAIMFVMTMKTLVKANDTACILQLNQHRSNIKLYTKLYLVMGLFWISDFIYVIYPECYLQLTADFICSLYGVFLFLVYICKENVIKKLFNSRGNGGDSASNTLELS